MLSVKAEQIATFLGRQITPLVAREIGSRFSTRIEGTCVKHRFGKCSIKMYDKCGIILRIETTTNDVSFFKHHRKEAEHRNRPPTRGIAPLKKTIYSLIDLREILVGCNRRYLAHLSALDDFSAGVRALGRLTKPHEVDGKTVKGIQLLRTRRQCSAACPAKSQRQHRWHPLRPSCFRTSKCSRPLGCHDNFRAGCSTSGVIKRIKGTYRLYYLTKAGRAATAAAERAKPATIVPAMI